VSNPPNLPGVRAASLPCQSIQELFHELGSRFTPHVLRVSTDHVHLCSSSASPRSPLLPVLDLAGHRSHLHRVSSLASPGSPRPSISDLSGLQRVQWRRGEGLTSPPSLLRPSTGWRLTSHFSLARAHALARHATRSPPPLSRLASAFRLKFPAPERRSFRRTAKPQAERQTSGPRSAGCLTEQITQGTLSLNTPRFHPAQARARAVHKHDQPPGDGKEIQRRVDQQTFRGAIASVNHPVTDLSDYRKMNRANCTPP